MHYDTWKYRSNQVHWKIESSKTSSVYFSSWLTQSVCKTFPSLAFLASSSSQQVITIQRFFSLFVFSNEVCVRHYSGPPRTLRFLCTLQLSRTRGKQKEKCQLISLAFSSAPPKVYRVSCMFRPTRRLYHSHFLLCICPLINNSSQTKDFRFLIRLKENWRKKRMNSEPKSSTNCNKSSLYYYYSKVFRYLFVWTEGFTLMFL